MSNDNGDVTLATQDFTPSSQDFDMQRIAAHEDFATKLAATAFKRKENQIQPVLAALEINNAKARTNYIRGKTNIFKKDVIIRGIIFLESIFTPKSPSTEAILKDKRIDEIKDKLVKFITAIAPNFCNNCDKIFSKQEGSKVTCYICTSNLCQECSSEDAFNKAKGEMKNITPICSSCLEELEEDESENVLDDKRDSPEDQSTEKVNTPIEVTVIQEVNVKDLSQPKAIEAIDHDAIETVEVIDDAEDDAPFQEVEKKNKKNKKNQIAQKQSEETAAAAASKSINAKENSKTEIKDTEDLEAKTCIFYVQYRCKFGTQGKGCSYEHPKLCRAFMKNSTEGCNKGESCQYLHPKMCSKSVRGQNCNSLKCFKGHFLGLRELSTSSQSKVQQNESNDSSSQKSKQDFHQDVQSSNKPKTHSKSNPTKTVVTPSSPTPLPPPPPLKLYRVWTS